MSIGENIIRFKQQLGEGATLVAVSKYSLLESVKEAYEAGHRDFGENKAQDLTTRQAEMPDDARWHFIGHLQRNKVKYIAPYIHLIHSVDSMRLLEEIDKQAAKCERTINCLLQMHIASEESKFGLDEAELTELLSSPDLPALTHIHIEGLMGMATNTTNQEIITKEFAGLKRIFDGLSKGSLPANVEMKTLSMGMSSDYEQAVAQGSTMVRIGSAIFNG